MTLSSGHSQAGTDPGTCQAGPVTQHGVVVMVTHHKVCQVTGHVPGTQ